jgi:ubiquinone/menaquinone biosynthesis C-methylase UbiE
MIVGRMGPIFNLIYDTYDNIRFVCLTAKRLVDKAKIESGKYVLDIACGTGWATMEAAKAVGKKGKVIGIDIAEKMLDVAKKKAEAAGISNIEYRLGDAEALDFKDDSFDIVLCASSVFILSDITKALKEWRRVLRPGGKVIFSSFGPDFMRPAYGMFLERLTRYDGLEPPTLQASARTGTPEKCYDILRDAGFKEIEVTSEQLGDYLQDIQEYWQEVSSTIMRPRLLRLSAPALQKFTTEHLAEVETLRTNKGIWINIPVYFSVAIK